MGEEINHELAMASVILDLLCKYGIPAAMDIIGAWDWDGEEGPTIEEIEALRDAVPDGEEYFDDEPGDEPEEPEAA